MPVIVKESDSMLVCKLCGAKFNVSAPTIDELNEALNILTDGLEEDKKSDIMTIKNVYQKMKERN